MVKTIGSRKSHKKSFHQREINKINTALLPAMYDHGSRYRVALNSFKQWMEAMRILQLVKLRAVASFHQ